MLLTIANAIWCIICIIGVINFFVGNGGIGSLCVSLPLLIGSIVYGILLNCFLIGVLIASLIGGIVIIVVFFFTASRIKPKSENKVEESTTLKDKVEPEEKTE